MPFVQVKGLAGEVWVARAENADRVRLFGELPIGTRFKLPSDSLEYPTTENVKVSKRRYEPAKTYFDRDLPQRAHRTFGALASMATVPVGVVPDEDD